MKKKTIKESKGTNYPKMKKKQTLFFTMQLLGKKYVRSFHFSGEKYQQMEIWTTGFLNFFKKWRAKTLM